MGACGGPKSSQTEPFQSLFELDDMEVHQEADPAARQVQVGPQLRVMNRKQAFYGLHLDDRVIANNKIEPIAGVELRALIHDRQWNLLGHRKAAHPQLARQSVFVGRLRQAWPKRPMHTQPGIHDDASQSILFGHRFIVRH